MNLDDVPDVDLELDLDLGALDAEIEPLDGLPDDADLPPPPAEPGGGPPKSDRDHWLARSPYWAIPLLVSVVFGLERIAMLAIVPGYRELPIIVFGGLFVLTFAAVLSLGGWMIHRQRY